MEALELKRASISCLECGFVAFIAFMSEIVKQLCPADGNTKIFLFHSLNIDERPNLAGSKISEWGLAQTQFDLVHHFE